MKKVTSLLVTVAVICLLCFGFTVEAASASLGGLPRVQPGQNITVIFNVSDNGSYGAQGYVNFDSSVLILNSVSTDLSGWKAEINGNKFLVYDDNYETPLQDSITSIIKFNFTVLSNVTSGKSSSVTVDNVTMSTTKNKFDKIPYNFTVDSQSSSSTVNNTSSTISTPTNNPTQNNNPTSPTTPKDSNTVSTAGKAVGNTASKVESSSVTVASDQSSETSGTSSVWDETSSDADTSSVSDSKTEKNKDDNVKNSNSRAKLIIIVVCVVVCGGAIVTLLYLKKKNNHIE